MEERVERPVCHWKPHIYGEKRACANERLCHELPSREKGAVRLGGKENNPDYALRATHTFTTDNNEVLFLHRRYAGLWNTGLHRHEWKQPRSVLEIYFSNNFL